MTAQDNFDLSDRNTLGLSSLARHGGLVTSHEDVERLDALAAAQDLPLRIIGGGSNVVLKPQLDAVVAVMAMKGRAISRTQDGTVLVCAQAGEDWPQLVQWTVDQGLGGLESLAGIPGTVGAAPVQNIGAYGLELADRFHSLTAYDLEDKRIRSFSRDACGFGYRQSLFKAAPRYVILDVTLALPQPWRPILTYRGLDTLSADLTPAEISAQVLRLRGEKLPDWRQLANAGSFFHNPVVDAEKAAAITGAPRFPQADGRVKLSAGWLIEACGLKGHRVGAAGIYDHHALIVVNHGGASFADVSALATTVRSAVQERFGIGLIQEPITL
ncbi:MAG TPA: UDP-N-acetylmuramate dehydrogenase [Pelagibacterium sp.]|uniref:UDP-N-acetylmuramate dehydrogenase n=1 Tax=Pelagibacterium sp. TaxID=1967288 RepID=UPI002B7F2B5B|nr:UDP-N-acetylmuramate dehydrogenase [Pelagibacterium sp.]HWJ88829.1 UDP-N-acetylmuramate dehydrogenase [Pelagibacterium sp.]